MVSENSAICCQSCAVLRSPHGTLLWSCVLFFFGSQQCLALDDASAGLWDAVIEQKIVSLSQSFQTTAEDVLRGSSLEPHTAWWWFTLIQQERFKEIIGLLNYEILYWDHRHWGYLAALICPLLRVTSPCLDKWTARAENHISLLITRNQDIAGVR